MKKAAAYYSIFIGISMISMWTFFYISGSIPELETEPASIIMHMLAEYITAIALIVGGYGILKSKTWGFNLYLLATGALIYTLIQSPGYYMNLGEIPFVLMFAVFFVLAVVFLVQTIGKGKATM